MCKNTVPPRFKENRVRHRTCRFEAEPFNFMKTRSLVLIFTLILFPSLGIRAEELPPLPEGPLLLTSITPEQLSPDYWVNRLPHPEALLKTPEEIRILNQEIRTTLTTQADVFSLEGRRRGKDIRDPLELEYETVKGRILFDVDGQKIPAGLFEQKIKPLMRWENVPAEIKVGWGVATRSTSVRALPSEVRMLEEIGDIEFDMLQYTLIKLWTPVGIYHVSGDGQWYYVQAPYVRGWVRARDIALFSSRAEMKKYADFYGGTAGFLTVTGESAWIFSDPRFQRKFQSPSMGTMIPLAEKTPGALAVWMPFRGEGGKVRLSKKYLPSASDLSEGFLPYTQRNVIRQAFKLLGTRYGWGGMYGGRDCSAFTQDVFLPFGIAMPRQSQDQIFAGTQINHFAPLKEPEAKAVAIRSGTPGVTLMRMPLHQMIYLGEVNGRFYAIHSTWAERISMTSDEKRRINQVVVSDLTLNGNSYLGSLFDRIIAVSEVL